MASAYFNMCNTRNLTDKIDFLSLEYARKKQVEMMKGRKVSNETRKKLSIARKKQKPPVPKGTKLSEEHKRKIGLANKGEKNGMYGKIGPRTGCRLTKETKQKISKAGKGRIVSEETRKKLSKEAVNQWLKQKNMGGD